MTKPRLIPHHTATQLEALLPDLLRVARYLTRDREAADDLVQDIVLRLWARMADPEKDAIDDLRGYAFSALRNRIRSRGSRQSFEDQLFTHGLAIDEIETGTSAAEGQAQMICTETLNALNDMPKAQAELIQMHGVEGLSYAEIGKRLGIGEGAVTSRLSRARKELRRRLDLPDGAPVTFLLE